MNRTFGYTYYDNGNVNTQTISGTGLAAQLTQTYTYDNVNRLTSAAESGSGTAWAQDYGYDQYGNRAVLTASAGYSPYLPTGSQTPQIATPGSPWVLGQNVSTVPFTTGTNRWKGLGSGDVDGAGNQTGQLCVGCGAASYDGEGRLAYVPSTSSAVQPVRYYYDGNGRRVMKVVCSPTSSTCDAAVSGAAITVFVYDAQGELAAEYSSSSPDTGRKFLFTDGLGSTRLYAAENGAVVNCYDYLPFGEEIGAAYGGRSGCFGTASYPGSAGVVSEKFTGKERDAETGLDYFGFRYLSSAQGRWTSPDKPFADQNPADPQSWNLYNYVRNNPLRSVDDNGLGTRPADDPRVNQFLARSADVSMNRSILASPNYSPWAFGRELGSSSMSSSLIGLAGEAVMLDRMSSMSLFGSVSLQPKLGSGVGGSPDMVLNFNQEGFGRADLANIAGPNGGLGHVPLDYGPAQAFFEVKTSSDYGVLLKGAEQAAATAGMIKPGQNAVSVLVVDQGAWGKLSTDQQNQILKTTGGGFVQLQKNLITDAIKRAAELRKKGREATGNEQ